MSKTEIIKLPDPRFHVYSLDDFIRHQEVTECWRNIDGEWKLLPIAFTEDWELEKCREEAAGITDRINRDLIAFAAVENDQIAGYITVVTKQIGSRKQYLQLEDLNLTEGEESANNYSRTHAKMQKRLAQKSYIFLLTLQKNQWQHIRHWDVFMHRKLSNVLPIKSLVMYNLNMCCKEALS